MFIVIICINIILITVRFKKEQERSKAGNVDIGVGEMIQEERKCSRNNVPSSKELTNVAVQEYGLGTNSTVCVVQNTCSFFYSTYTTSSLHPTHFHFCFFLLRSHVIFMRDTRKRSFITVNVSRNLYYNSFNELF